MEKKYEDCYVKIDGDTATIGFNDDEDSLKTISDIVFMEFSVKPGDDIKEGDKLLSAEAMKGTLQLKSRINGKVLEVNSEIEENPEKLKDKPKEWLFKIKL